MISNYIKVALRSIFRNKLTAFINIAGLALAMACALLIYLFINDEIGFDKYNSKVARTYRVTRNFFSRVGASVLNLATVAPPIGPLLKNDFGEIEVMARTLNNQVVIGREEQGELKKSFTEEIYFAEPDLFKIFDITMKEGDPVKGLGRPFMIMLSEKAAVKYFGTENCMGKHLRGSNQYDLEVSGVFQSFPLQSHWHPDFLISFITLEDNNVYGRKGLETNWGNNSFSTYLLLDEGASASKLEAQMPAFIDKHYGPYAKANFNAPADFVASKSTALSIQKVTDIHLRSHLDDELEVNGNINNVYMMGVIGIFIVLIACFNFINLSTARATKRAKEVGLRKVVGAFKIQLVYQYLSESVLISFFALLLAAGISAATIGWLNSFTGKGIALNFITNWPITAGLILFSILVGVLAGIYPAFVISGYNPALVLKGQQGSVSGKSSLRKVLVVAQFAISIFLIIATAVTFQQLRYLNSRSLGFDKDQVITLPYYSLLDKNYDAFYNELTKSAAIKNLTRSSRVPTGRLLDSQGTASIVRGNDLVDSGVELKYITTDYEFFDTFGMTMAAGRAFSRTIPSDDTLAYIVNEAAVRAVGYKSNEEGIGKDFKYGMTKGKLVGVVKDFHFESLHQKIVPMIFLPMKQSYYNMLSLKISGNEMKEGIAALEKVWKQFLPGRPFDYQFLSDRYRRLYLSEQKENQLFTAFSGIAIFIASLGLFGLATFNTLQRVKEIGIRKVLGASVPSILALLSREIIVLIAIANVVAWPFAWFFMGKWLDTFSYHIGISMVVFLAAAAGAIAIALLTVSSQTIKAAIRNPSNTLRYE